METTRAETTAVPTTDMDLAARIVQSDRAAFAAMMRQHNRRLYRVARAILDDDAEAEEALQEAYLIAYQKMATFLGQSKLSTWLTRIVINEALQRRRKSQRHGVVIPFENVDHGAQSMTTTVEKPETPERATMRAEMRRLLEREIASLPIGFRTVFILRELEDMTVEECAECLELPEATVRTRLFRAKAQLREALAREMDLATEDAFDFAGARCDRVVTSVLARIPTRRDSEST
ncbi:MAG: RNA polymerase sigma factor [Sulfurifustaceae bacterium]